MSYLDFENDVVCDRVNVWGAPRIRGGLVHMFYIALPLVIATSGHAVRLFCDRTMLSRVSSEALRASLSAGVMWFMLACFLLGVVGYAGTFVAQYVGAKQEKRVGPVIWHASYIGLAGACVILFISFFAEQLFDSIGYGRDIRAEQVVYFRILCSGTVATVMLTAVLSFWQGRGQTWIIALIEGIGVSVNIFANWVLIFGHLGFSAYGIAGAGYATVFSTCVSLLVAVILIASSKYRIPYNTFPRRKFEPELLKRMLRFGFPAGMNFFLDVAAFNIFIIVVSKIGAVEGAASTMAFTLNAQAFIPLIGVGMATGILVGQAIGSGDIAFAKKAVRSARVIIFSYAGLMLILFAGFPHLVEKLFTLDDMSPAQARATYDMTAVFLKFIAAYLMFNGACILYQSAIRGAGDTQFPMWATIILGWSIFAIPCLIMSYFKVHVWWYWRLLVLYIVLLSIVLYARYKQGKWQEMSVIEKHEA